MVPVLRPSSYDENYNDFDLDPPGLVLTKYAGLFCYGDVHKRNSSGNDRLIYLVKTLLYFVNAGYFARGCILHLEYHACKAKRSIS